MAGAVSDLYDLAHEWLEVCSEAVTATFGGAISRAFVCDPPPAFDCCPQLTVHLGGPSEADTVPQSPPLIVAERANFVPNMNLVAMTATVVRCNATAGDNGEEILLPDPADIELVARATSEDVWAIWNYTKQRHRENVLFSSRTQRRELFLDAPVAVAAQGGCSGWTLPIRVQVDGFSPSS